MTLRTALLACETGTGRGHVITLAGVAQALAGRWSCVAALSRLEYAPILQLLAREVVQAPVMARRPDVEVLSPRPAPMPPRVVPDLGGRPIHWADSWANWIGRRGFRDVNRLRAQVRFWQDQIWRHRAELVVTDYAPSALLAARALGVPSVVTGLAIGIAPVRMPRFPVFGGDDDGVVLDEDETAALISEAIAPLGGVPLARLAELYTATMPLPRGFAAWDPYADWRDEPRLTPIENVPSLVEGPGDVIFAYLSTTEVDQPGILAALRASGLPVMLFAPGLTGAQAQTLMADNPRLTVSNVPFPLEEILARARLVLCAGQAGTAATAMLAGVPMLALPQHNEQLAHARGAVGLGGHRLLMRRDWNAARINAALHEMWDDGALRQAARQTALRLRAEIPRGALEDMRAALGRF